MRHTRLWDVSATRPHVAPTPHIPNIGEDKISLRFRTEVQGRWMRRVESIDHFCDREVARISAVDVHTSHLTFTLRANAVGCCRSRFVADADDAPG